MEGTVKFKHFANKDPDGLMEDLQDWVNGGTDYVHWVSEFSVVLKGNDYHAFIKYIEKEV